jgi:hypothetical protein
MHIWRRYLKIVCAAILLGDFAAVCTLVAIYRLPEWHAHLLRFSAACYVAFLGLEGSSSHGFFSPIAVSLFTIIASIIVIRYMHGVATMKTRLWEDTMIALTALIVFTTLVYAPQFVWEVARTAYDDHGRLVRRVQHLQGYAENESRFQQDLLVAQAKANHWRDAYTSISKGETVPDRIMNRADMEKLHDKLEEYRKASKERKFSTVRISPAFPDDQESLHLAFNILKVFKDAHWNATWEAEHGKELSAILRSTLPKGIVIFSDDPHVQADWIRIILSDVDVYTVISDRVPDGFKGTLVCIGYKEFEPLKQ